MKIILVSKLSVNDSKATRLSRKAIPEVLPV